MGSLFGTETQLLTSSHPNGGQFSVKVAALSHPLLCAKPFSLAEVFQATASLSRHKAAGADGLNNDFIKDYQALLAPALVTIGNDILQGRMPSASFLEELIIPLRKKGDSKDAMDYRTIALLQSGYKVVAKVLSHRVQNVSGVPIQQGFVHGPKQS